MRYNFGLPSLWEPHRGRSRWGKPVRAPVRTDRFTGLRWRVSSALAACSNPSSHQADGTKTDRVRHGGV